MELTETIDKSKIKNVLDLGCGMERSSICFVEVGFKVPVADSSSEVLTILKQRVVEKALEIKIIKGDYLDKLFSEESCDLVLAYNVIYHGYRQDVEHAMCLIHGLLEPRGLFFFTCPTRRDDKYGNGEQVPPNTYKPLKGAHPGDIRYFADEADVSDFLHKVSEISPDIYDHCWDDKGI